MLRNKPTLVPKQMQRWKQLYNRFDPEAIDWLLFTIYHLPAVASGANCYSIRLLLHYDTY